MEVKTAFQLKLNHILVLKDEIAEIKSMIETFSIKEEKFIKTLT